MADSAVSAQKSFNNSGSPSYDLGRAENEITILLMKFIAKWSSFQKERRFKGG